MSNINLYNYSILFLLLKGHVISHVKIKRRINFSIITFQEIKSYKGMRHLYNKPVHGQRTRTNANTQRAKKVVLRPSRGLNRNVKKFK